MALPVATDAPMFCTNTPSPPLKAMVLPSSAVMPPTVLFDRTTHTPCWLLPRGVPVTPTPIRLPCSRLLLELMLTPVKLPEMTLPAPAVVPPTVSPTPSRLTPVEFPRAAVPWMSVPMRLPWTRFLAPPLMLTPLPLPEMTLRASGVVPPIRLSSAPRSSHTP